MNNDTKDDKTTLWSQAYNFVKNIHKELNYPYSNENLEAITNTLDITSDDRIISICGSGAQPLALLQYLTGNGKILAIDYNIYQIKFAKEALDKIIDGDYNAENLDITPRNKGYFLEMNRVKNLYENKDKIVFKVVDVSNSKDISNISEKFTKGYFSNAEVNIMEFKDSFESGSLIYITSFPFQSLFGDFVNEKTIEEAFAINVERTKLAKELERMNTRLIKPNYKFNRVEVEHWEWQNPVVLVRK